MNQLNYPDTVLNDGARSCVLRWQHSVLQLEAAKANEIELRKGLTECFFPDGLKEGTNRITGADFQIDVVQPMNTKIDDAALGEIMREMPKEFKTAGVLIGWKPVLVKSGYDALPEQDRKVFDQALTITPGTVQLEVKLGVGFTTKEQRDQLETKAPAKRGRPAKYRKENADDGLTPEEIAELKKSVTADVKTKLSGTPKKPTSVDNNPKVKGVPVKQIVKNVNQKGKRKS